jgi:hypothetical protein
LPDADLVIVFGENGRLVQLGTFKDLRSVDGYIRSLGMTARPKHDNEEISSTGAGSQNKATPVVGDVEEEARQINDLSIYKYYAATP